MSIDNLVPRLQALADALARLGLGRYDCAIDVRDDVLGAVEEGVNSLALDLETLYMANQEKATYLELQQRALTAKEQDLREKSALLAEQLATIGTQRALLDARERELAQMTATIQGQSEAIRELSVPVIEVEDGIVVLPVIGSITAARAEEIMQTLLTYVVSSRSRHVIIDLTGVSVIDTQTADYIEKIVGAVRLLGARCLLSGINPAVAHTLVELGAGLRGIGTFRNLKEALREALRAATRTRSVQPR